MKVANIIGKVIMVIFGLASLGWIAAMLGLFGMRFGVYNLPKVGLCIAIFFIGLIITVSTSKKAKKK